MAKKYIKDSKGSTVAVTTDTLGLEKPLLNENYDIDVHNRNMDKIDEDLKPIDDSYIIELFQHDGDTTNPRDYYTKVEADEKFASKEEANNALNKANEAFQRGDNVKTQLVDKLISEGLDVSTNNTFEELIDNIALGKKWASGKSYSLGIKKTFNYIGIGTSSRYYAKIPKLNFTPNHIFYVATSGTLGFGIVTSIAIPSATTEKSVLSCQRYNSSALETSVLGIKGDDAVFINDGTIDVPFETENTSSYIEWIAIE